MATESGIFSLSINGHHPFPAQVANKVYYADAGRIGYFDVPLQNNTLRSASTLTSASFGLPTTITAVSGISPCVSNNMVYFSSRGNRHCIWRSNYDFTHMELMVSGNEQFNNIVVDNKNNFVYYLSNSGIFKTDPQFRSRQQIVASGNMNRGATFFDIDTVNDHLYLHHDFVSGIFTIEEIYRCSSIDGSNFQLFSRNTTNDTSTGLKTSNGTLYIARTLNGLYSGVTPLPNYSGYAFFAQAETLSPEYLFMLDVAVDELKKNIYAATRVPSYEGNAIFMAPKGSDFGSTSSINLGTDNALIYMGLATQPNEINLYIKGIGFSSSGVDLFIYGYDLFASQIPLSITGHIATSSGCNLSISGIGVSSGICSLYKYGFDIFSGSIPLYQHGHILLSGYHDIYISGKDTSSGNINLHINGHQTNNNNITLFEGGFNTFSGSNNLYINGFATFSNNITLFINPFNTSSGNMPLCIFGLNIASGYIDLSIIGHLITSGINPLYIGGKNNVSGLMPLYINAFNFSSGTIPLIIYGALNVVSGSVPLFTLSLINTISGYVPLNIFGNEESLNSSCPLLDPNASIQISDSLITIYQERVDALINQIGGYLVLQFEDSRSICPNCLFDSINNRSNGIYRTGGPRPFSRGQKCPHCKGEGFLNVSVEKCIQALIKWNPKSSVLNRSTNSGITRAIVRTKTLFDNADDIVRAKTAILKPELSSTQKIYLKRISGPLPAGLREDRYCITFWEVIKM